MSQEKQGFNKEEFIGKAEGNLTDKYDIIKEIGSGGFSRCLLVKNKITNQNFACKELIKKSISNYHLNQYAKSYFFAYKMSFSSCCDFTKILALNLSLNLTIQDVVKSPLYHNYYSSTPVKSNQKTGTNSISFTTKLGVKIKIL